MVQGKLVGPDDPDIPDEVYHVTTNIGAVKKSGKLKVAAGLEGGGLGGGSEIRPGVSLTTSYEDAKLIQREMRRITGSVRFSTPMKRILNRWAREDEKIAGLEKGALQNSVDSAMHNYEFHWGQYPERHSDPSWVRSLRFDAGRQYWMSREIAGGPANIIVTAADASRFASIRPNQIKIIKIPKSSVFASGGAVLTHVQPGDHLHEVRVYGDVPVGRVRVTEISEAHRDWKERAR